LLNTSLTVVSSTADDALRSIGPNRNAAGVWLSMIRWMLKSTSSAVNGAPLCVVIPAGMVIVHSVPSALGVTSLAITSSGEPSAAIHASGS